MTALIRTASSVTRMVSRSRLFKLAPRTYRSLGAAPHLANSYVDGTPSERWKTSKGFSARLPTSTSFTSARWAQVDAQAARAQSSKDLPRLPVPKLHDTLQKYLKTVKPLVTPEEYRVTENVVRDFGAPGGMGERLQELLEAKAKSTDNWLSEWWLNLAYLHLRLPLPVWSSPGIILPTQKAESQEDQLRLAARIITGIVDYKTMVDNRAIPQEMMGKTPLDMSQYNNIFYTCRIPGKTVDKLVHYGDVQPLPTHIIVMRKNNFFHFEVYDKSGAERLSEDQLVEQLRAVVLQSEEPGLPLGICTSDNRANWGAAYDALRQAKGNKALLGSINSSICLVCLDGPNPDMSKNAPDERTVAALEMIHGCGKNGNAGNRWFDKTIQFIVGSRGQVGMTYEHSPAEGPPIANLTDHVMDVVTGKHEVAQKRAASVHPPKKLEFTIPDAVKDAMNTAAQNLDGLVSDLEMTMYSFNGYGKNFIKQQKMSPDSYIQTALQLAFYRIHGEPAATYESASTRKYLHGRTECIRSCSIESTTFCQTMLSKDASIDEKVASMRRAIDVHKKYVLEAVNGFGVDRHLLGLKQTAIENGLDLHELYLDPGYSRSSHMRLSTSQVPARYDTVMCFGPLVPDGYGCCYNPRADSINFGLSALYASPETHSGRLRDALEESLSDMRDVLSVGSSKL